MSTETFDDCSALPQVALPFMNTVHCEELTMVAELLSKLANSAPAEQIDEAMLQWISHTEAHFTREEKYMQQYSFPPFPMHKGEHEKAFSALCAVHQSWQQSRDIDALTHYIRDQWRPWLDQHISTMDTVTAHFLSQFDIQI